MTVWLVTSGGTKEEPWDVLSIHATADGAAAAKAEHDEQYSPPCDVIAWEVLP